MNLQYYKQNVSIIQLVETLGYAYNRNKGRYPKQYEHPNGDKVIIYDKAKSIGESYFTRNSFDDKGSVIDFVKNRLPMFNVQYHSEWEGVLKVLAEFSGDSFDQNITKQRVDLNANKARNNFNPNLFEVKQAKLKDLSYLRFERKLNKDTLSRFIPYIQTVRRKGKKFTNIGFFLSSARY
jgi:predicted RNA binding protein YcfA (HicA-like mRNA interferase family)